MVVFAIQAAMVGAIMVVAVVLYGRLEHFDHERERELQSSRLASELRQSSDDLTQMARSFVDTGDPVFRDRYDGILEIRAGTRPRPRDYDRVYWDLVTRDNPKPRPDGRAIALHTLMTEAGFTDRELAQLGEAERRSNELANVERAAMALAVSDPARARAMLDDDAYHQAKAAIMQAIDDFTEMYRLRTGEAVHTARDVARNLMLLLLALAGSTILAVAISFAALRHQIARREEQQAARGRTDARYHELVANLEDVVFSTDREGRIEFMSPAAERVYGFLPDEVRGLPFGEFVHPDDYPGLLASFGRTLAGTTSPYRFRAFDKQGRVRYLRTASRVRLEDGQPAGVDGVIVDESALREAEAARQATQAMLRSAFAASPGVTAIVEIGERIGFVDVNEAFERITGYSREEAIGSSGRELEFHVDPGVYVQIMRAFQTGQPVRGLVYPLRRKDGTVITTLFNCEPFEVDGRRFALTVNSDVTELEQTLAFESLLADLAARLVHADDERLDEIISQAQARICAVYDLDRSSVMQPAPDGQLMVTHMHPGPSGIAKLGAIADSYFPWTIARLRASKQSVYVEDVEALPDEARLDRESHRSIGNTSNLHVPWLSSDGGLSGLLNFSSIRGRVLSPHQMREVETLAQMLLVAIARVRERRAVAASQARNRVLIEMLDEAPAGILVGDEHAHILYANRAMAQMHGYTPEEFARCSVIDLTPPENAADAFERHDVIVDRGQHSFDSWHIRKDGSRFHVQVRALRSHWGDRAATLAVTIDLTERDQAEAELDAYRRHLEELVAQRTRELRDARDAADQANRAKSRFLANMSHEIRTPMNAVLGFTQLLLRDPSVTVEQRRHLETVNRAGDHLLSLIDGILQLAKVESGHSAPVITAFDLWQLAEDIERLFRPRASDKGLRLVLTRDAAVPHMIESDEGKLRQVISNLVGNAIKFTAKGSVTLKLAMDGERLAVEVSDTGPGIAREEMVRLFEIFEQTETGRASNQGSGLGLAISRELVRVLNGEISADSEVGVGTTFRFSIPIGRVTDAPVISRTRSARKLAPGHAAVKALIVDDVEDNRTLLAALLGRLGLETRTCGDGATAVREFATWRPHVILMDMRMPVLDGVAAIEQIRALPGGDFVRFVCVTASAYPEDEQKARAAGAHGFLTKPVREDKLVDVLTEVLELRVMAASTAVPAEHADEPTAEATAALPDTLRARLRRATRLADQDDMFAVIDAASVHAPVVARGLRALAERYAYQRILDLLGEA